MAPEQQVKIGVGGGDRFWNLLRDLASWLNDTDHYVDVVVVSNQANGEALLYFGRAHGRMASVSLDTLKFSSKGGVFFVDYKTGAGYLDTNRQARFELSAHRTSSATPTRLATLTVFADASYSTRLEEIPIRDFGLVDGMLTGVGTRGNGLLAPCSITFQKRKSGPQPA